MNSDLFSIYDTGRFFVALYIGNKTKDATPKRTIEAIFEVQTIQPKAVPTVKGTSNKIKTPAMAAG